MVSDTGEILSKAQTQIISVGHTHTIQKKRNKEKRNKTFGFTCAQIYII
jgi:hypothetical protein